VVRHRGGLLQCAAVLEVRGDFRRAEAVIAELGGDAGRRRAPADHGVWGREVRVSWPRPVRDGPEQRPLGVAAQAEPVEIGGQVLFKFYGGFIPAQNLSRKPPSQRRRPIPASAILKHHLA
jgi:hypothetical protein